MAQFLLTTLLLAFVAHFAHSWNASCLPTDPDLVGKTTFSFGGCSRGGSQYGYRLKMDDWTISMFTTGNSYLCPGERHVTYTKRDAKAEIWLRRGVKERDYFKTVAPQIYAKWLQTRDIDIKWPCDRIPLEKITVWGPQRKKFMSTISDLVQNAEHMRDFECRGRAWNRIDVEALRLHIRITQSAITYFRAVAYENFFCVCAPNEFNNYCRGAITY